MDRGVETRKKILEVIVNYIQEHGYSPTVREICSLTGLKSTQTVQHHIQIMFERGALETDCEKAGSSRAIRVPGYKFVKI